jgi:preprotein translocase subunit SecA
MHMVQDVIEDAVTMHCPANLHREEWDLTTLLNSLAEEFLPYNSISVEEIQGMSHEELVETLMARATELYQAKEAEIGSENMRELERMVMLRVVDSKWVEHLDAMETLREGVGLRAYGQNDPLVVYKTEAYDMYQNMVGSIREEVVRILFHLQVAPNEDIEQLEEEVAPRPFQVIAGGHAQTKG